MSASSVPVTRASSCYGSEVEIDPDAFASVSDYGSEFDATEVDEDTILANTLDSLVQQLPRSVEKSIVLPSIEFEQREAADEESNDLGVLPKPYDLRVAKSHRRNHEAIDSRRRIQSSPTREMLEVEYDERSRRAWSVPLKSSQSSSQSGGTTIHSVSSITSTPHIVSSHEAADVDSRPPIERFRTKPKKPLSVTDLVSPAWCELQYYYTLSKFGRKPRTQAMRTGSKIHQKLEDEVHTTVPVQVQTKEDRFGLRIWNTISGLRCLRETGLTRELEVWGVVEDQVVNGVIDEVSYECPDPEFEEHVERTRAQQSGGTVQLPTNQLRIAEAFARASGADINSSAWADGVEPIQQIYIADVKTRGVRSKPTGASLRPTRMQLMLYHKLLESLSLNTVDAETIFARYDLDPLQSFTEIFLHEIGDVGFENEAARFPNLLSLWSLLITELQLAIPPASLSYVLCAEFRYSKTGDIIGNELIMYEANVLEDYLEDEMAWWKGTREAKGVAIEDAFKCRICDFAENCTWRQKKVDEAVEKSRLRRLGGGKSAV
ncbi:exonuclease V a 5' deoxyribonuclease-domain-containing protein [Boeremia exigua]|uniref:exonuclease V a 5' deoxyribonuclease-domain-containing protein n=1 Tax=Boeremia exigua TaxID=749465 RepID=UPI001E8DCA81|nr:exonuclease V a 5' deoxyribonuclease-domain-containing protein [Boeremia exigua]KAH6643981.1 exonuclease V a 5' deoxyribonuclease-domain-containing protein [Boeremia exigua]